MSTNSTITIKLLSNDDTETNYLSCYCHWDGYITWVGKMLVENYNTHDLAYRLIEKGSISSLAQSNEWVVGHDFDNPVKGHTVYYGRDRGEDNTEPKLYHSWEECIKNGESYNYLFDNGVWYVQDSTTLLRPVISILAGIEDDELKAEEKADEINYPQTDTDLIKMMPT